MCVPVRNFCGGPWPFVLCCRGAAWNSQNSGLPTTSWFSQPIPEKLTEDYVKQVFVEACAARNSKSFTEAMKQVRAPALDLVAHLGRFTCVRQVPCFAPGVCLTVRHLVCLTVHVGVCLGGFEWLYASSFVSACG